MEQLDKDYLEEIILKAVQSGKSETSGLVESLRKDTSAIKETLAIVVTNQRETNKHLADLNGKVARHELDIGNLKMDDLKSSMALAAVIKEQEEKSKEEKDKTKEEAKDKKDSANRWKERIIWGTIVVALLVLVKTGLLSKELLPFLD